MNSEQALRSLGLNESEVKIYLELLKMGSSKVNELAKRLNLPRTTVYNVLDSLMSKGAVSYVIKAGVKHYEAAEPSSLLALQEEKLTNLKEVIPELEKNKGIIGIKPEVEVYEGKEGLKTILENILKMPAETVLYAYANNDMFEYLRFYFPHFVTRRAKNKIHAKIIQEKTEKSEEYKKKETELLLEMKFSSQRFESSVFIFGNKIAIMTFSKEMFLGVLIENESISRAQKQVFDILWNSSK